MTTLFFELGVVIAIATAFALLVRSIHQPPLLGYILTGITLGPLGTHFISNYALFDGMKQLGVALLLFLVGLELDWTKAKHQLSTTFVLGTAQVLGSFALGLFFALALGLNALTGLYIGTALAFSSTVIVVKLLSESRDLNSLHGRLSIGILLLQDFVAVISLVILNGLATPTSMPIALQFSLVLIKTIALLVLLRFIALYILPPLFAKIAHSGELLFLSSIAWCFVVGLVTAHYDFPLELGSFLAGISLASLPYSLDILNRLRSLRDFFVILLFVNLGSSLILPSSSYLLLTLGMLFITVFMKPVLGFAILIQRRYRSRTAFMTALTQGQLSEFSLILISIGLEQHQILPQVASSIVFTAIFSLFISTILLTRREQLYHFFRPFLHRFENKKSKDVLPMDTTTKLKDHIIIFGYHRMGYHILKKLRSLNHQVLIVDFNPDIIKRLREQKVECVYGDVQDEDILEQIQAKSASMIISTIPHREETLYLIEKVKAMRQEPLLIVTSHHIDDALEYYKLDASYVILPHLLGGEHVADLITQYQHKTLATFLKHRAEEVKLLRTKNHALYCD